MDLSHRVVAAVEGQPRRVECQTCHTQHNYRAPKGAKSPIPREVSPPKEKAAAKAKKVPAKRVTKAESQLIADWDTKVHGQLERAFTNYTISDVLKVNQLVRHKQFGEGYVYEVLGDNKLIIVFRGGSKTLIHGR
ncbi:MAG: hypothetical protein RJA70_2685 [Pseudomonadota bacterium]|jgi:hypothetical protein